MVNSAPRLSWLACLQEELKTLSAITAYLQSQMKAIPQWNHWRADEMFGVAEWKQNSRPKFGRVSTALG